MHIDSSSIRIIFTPFIAILNGCGNFILSLLKSKYEKEFVFDNSYEEIPKYWDEICEKHCTRIYAGQEPETPEEKAIVDTYRKQLSSLHQNMEKFDIEYMCRCLSLAIMKLLEF